MIDEIASASARPLRGSVAAGVASVLLALAAVTSAHAQPAPAAAQPQTPQLIYSPWIKQCGQGQEAGAKKACITGRSSYSETGFPMVSAVLVEPEGERKLLRVTVPEPIAVQPGTRIMVDQGQPASAAYITCFQASCMAEIEATPDFVAKMKAGTSLFVQAVTLDNQVISLPLPLADFKKVNEGAASDPKVVEEQATKLRDQLQKLAEAARAKAGQQPPK
jgi:invasion protein IalB